MTNPLTSSLFPDSHPESLSSHLTSAAIGEQLVTCDETGIIGCQEQRGSCNFVRLSHATPFFDEELRDGQAYPFRPSRDERHSSLQLAHATSRPIDRSVRLAPSYSSYLPCAGGPGQETADAATRSKHPRPRGQATI